MFVRPSVCPSKASKSYKRLNHLSYPSTETYLIAMFNKTMLVTFCNPFCKSLCLCIYVNVHNYVLNLQ